MLFICYSRCSTCKKAQAYLDAHSADYSVRDITVDNPKEDEIKTWKEASGLPIKRFFNTSGLQYRALELSRKLPDMTEAEQIKLLATDGMLVKRPILVGDGFVLVGFREKDWAEKIG